MTKNSQYYLDFKEIIEEEKNFYQKGFERIKDYYSLPEDVRQEKTGRDVPLHESFMKDSGIYILNGISVLAKRKYDLREHLYIFNSLVGIGTEVLLKAIILKINPEVITKYTKDIIDFEILKQNTLKHLKAKLNQKETDRVKDVLDLVQLRRNRYVHLGLHKTDHYAIPYQIAHVLAFLYRYFFPETSKEIVARLEGFKEKHKVTSGMDFEPVSF